MHLDVGLRRRQQRSTQKYYASPVVISRAEYVNVVSKAARSAQVDELWVIVQPSFAHMNDAKATGHEPGFNHAQPPHVPAAHYDEAQQRGENDQQRDHAVTILPP